MDSVHQLEGHSGHVGEPAIIGIVTISDRASAGKYEDEGGPAVLSFLREGIASPLTVHYRCVPDDRAQIESTLVEMRAISLQYVPTAILSRQIGGIRGKCLLFNLPGRPKSIRETIDEIWKAVPYCVDLLGGPYIDSVDSVCNAFRPKSARRR